MEFESVGLLELRLRRQVKSICVKHNPSLVA